VLGDYLCDVPAQVLSEVELRELRELFKPSTPRAVSARRRPAAVPLTFVQATSPKSFFDGNVNTALMGPADRAVQLAHSVEQQVNATWETRVSVLKAAHVKDLAEAKLMYERKLRDKEKAWNQRHMVAMKKQIETKVVQRVRSAERQHTMGLNEQVAKKVERVIAENERDLELKLAQQERMRNSDFWTEVDAAVRAKMFSFEKDWRETEDTWLSEALSLPFTAEWEREAKLLFCRRAGHNEDLVRVCDRFIRRLNRLILSESTLIENESRLLEKARATSRNLAVLDAHMAHCRWYPGVVRSLDPHQHHERDRDANKPQYMKGTFVTNLRAPPRALYPARSSSPELVAGGRGRSRSRSRSRTPTRGSTPTRYAPPFRSAMSPRSRSVERGRSLERGQKARLASPSPKRVVRFDRDSPFF
jgi:hypothetical protein